VTTGEIVQALNESAIECGFNQGVGFHASSSFKEGGRGGKRDVWRL